MKPLCDSPRRLRAALRRERGNLTRTARLLGVSKPYLVELVTEQGLNEFARALRQENGQPSTGRPPKTRPVL